MYLTPPSPPRSKAIARYLNEDGSKNFTQLVKLPPQSPGRKPLSLYANPISGGHLSSLQPPTVCAMTTTHRGLERSLPAGMILPDPSRQQLPQQQPPAQTQQQSAQFQQQTQGEQQYAVTHARLASHQDPGRGGQPTTRQALPFERDDFQQSRTDIARIEEYRLKQEEFKTRQEEMRLEQRRLEYDMLREAIAKGVHPNLVPLIFVGLAGATSGQTSGSDMAQQYITQLQSIGVQVQNQLSPDLRRDSRPLPSGQLHYGAFSHVSPPTAATSHMASPANAAGVYPSPAYHSPHGHARTAASSQLSRPLPPAAIAPPALKAPQVQSSLPRLTTNEAQVQAGAPLGSTAVGHGSSSMVAGLGSSSQIASQTLDSASASPSSLSFLHWQPPSSGKESQKTSPQSRPGAAGSEYTATPRKRKAVGAHHAPTASISAQSHPGSPTLSTVSTASKRPGRRRSSVISINVDKVGASREHSQGPTSTAQDSSNQMTSKASTP